MAAHPRSSHLLQYFVESQVKLSHRFDRLFPAYWHIDGMRDFVDHLLPEVIHPGLRIYDIGSGRDPVIRPSHALRNTLNITGIDISESNLKNAPVGAYDKTVCADASRFRGHADGDLAICKNLIEHVKDVDGVFGCITSVLRPGGCAAIFTPSRNAVFARLNLVLPQELKRRILFTLFPRDKTGGGYPAYYTDCTPKRFRHLAQQHSLTVQQERLYYFSPYFTFFAPLFAAWRMWVALFKACAREQAAESFAMVLRKEK